MLGAIESLLSATVADGMTGERHDPDGELLAQGIGNLVAPFFGGIAATGAIARTATNIRAGARSPLAAVVHAGVLLAATVILAPVLSELPMASLAALLLVVAWHMAEVKHAVHQVRRSPRGDVFVLVTCFSLTVLFDMVVSVGVGIVLAALLFMRRVVEMSDVRLAADHPAGASARAPHGVVVYEIHGPLFFGAAQKAMSALQVVEHGVRVVVLDLAAVPAIDSTGLVNLESAIGRLHRAHVAVLLAEVRPRVRERLERAGLGRPDDDMFADLTSALAAAERRLPPPPAPSKRAVSSR